LRQPSKPGLNVVFSKVPIGHLRGAGWLVFLIVVIIFLITVASQATWEVNFLNFILILICAEL
jgi:hypothetical protein